MIFLSLTLLGIMFGQIYGRMRRAETELLSEEYFWACVDPGREATPAEEKTIAVLVPVRATE